MTELAAPQGSRHALPLGFFTGLMGINVGGMPGVEDSGAFWVVVGLCVGLSLLLAAVFRWRNWF